MKHYTFEYTDTKYFLKLAGIFIAILIGLIVCSQYLVLVLGKNGGIILILALPALVVWLLRKGLKKHALADLDTSFVKFDFGDRVEEIDFKDLQSYKVEHYNGTTLSLKLADRKNIKITANSNFCNSVQFELFCRDLEEVIQRSNEENISEVTRVKSIFEQKWMLPFLIVFTSGIIWVIAHSLMSGKGVPTSLYTSIAIFIGMWAAYFKGRQKK